MAVFLYNTPHKKVQKFIPVQKGIVRMYNCGPTVYSTAHIGNFRSFVVIDLLRRVLEYQGYEVLQVMNITDVGHLTDDGDDGEDKLEVAAKKEKKHPLDIAKQYTDEFLRDWNALFLKEPLARPKATDSIPEMIVLIQKLLDTGHAYHAGGNIYFDITSFPKYGEMSGNTLDKLTHARVESDPHKRHPQDFVLWFSNSKFKNHILQWDSPWGKGYPGWHIECSAMAARWLSDAFKDGSLHEDLFETIDIHTGGEDNRFPHHECEIAQSECSLNKPYVNYWLHVRHLLVEGEKMSKSVGNIYYVHGLIQEGFSPRAIRYVLLATHYRSPLNFTKQGLVAAQKNLDKVDDLLVRLDALRAEHDYNESLGLVVREKILAIEEQLADDLNVSGALGSFFEMIKHINKEFDSLGNKQAGELVELLFDLDRLFGFIPRSVLEEESLPQDVLDILQERSLAREQKDYQKSDELRDILAEKGFIVKDTPDGQSCSRR